MVTLAYDANVLQASFRSSFGNTILSPDHMIGNHTTDMLTSRFNSAFSLSNMVLAGSGISQPALEEIGTQIEESAAMNRKLKVGCSLTSDPYFTKIYFSESLLLLVISTKILGLSLVFFQVCFEGFICLYFA